MQLFVAQPNNDNEDRDAPLTQHDENVGIPLPAYPDPPQKRALAWPLRHHAARNAANPALRERL